MKLPYTFDFEKKWRTYRQIAAISSPDRRDRRDLIASTSENHKGLIITKLLPTFTIFNFALHLNSSAECSKLLKRRLGATDSCLVHLEMVLVYTNKEKEKISHHFIKIQGESVQHHRIIVGLDC